MDWLSVSLLAQTQGIAWSWQGETRTVANVSTNVSICVSISNMDEWSAWQPGLVCPQPGTGGPTSLASCYLQQPECASHPHEYTEVHTPLHYDETTAHPHTHTLIYVSVLFVALSLRAAGCAGHTSTGFLWPAGPHDVKIWRRKFT